ncbi:MAG TPA: CHAT domain-containing protein [Thermoanaerobaculia bacterium]|nr:CHAT domain-containing protein [Thermoanaerobaculia bacterium]
MLVPLLAALLLCAATAAPATPEDAARLARTAIDRAQYVEAQRILDEALARFGTRDSETVWKLRVMRGELAMSTRGLAKADELLRFELPAKYRNSEAAVQHAVMRALAARAIHLMQRAFDLATKHHPKLLADVHLYNSSLVYNSSLGKTPEEALGGARTALASARTALELAQKNGRRDTEARATANVAFFLSHGGRLTDGVEWGERAVTLLGQRQLTKHKSVAAGNLGWAYFELGDYEAAERLYLVAANAAPRYDMPVWLIARGNVEYQRRNWQDAIRLNSEAARVADEVGRDKSLGYAYANMARSYLELGHLDDAARFNAKAHAAKKGDAEAIRSSRVVDARIAVLRGDRTGAEKIFQDVLRQQPSPATLIEAETYFAILLASAGRNAEARTHFERATRIVNDKRGEIADPDLRFAFLNTAAYMFDEYVDFLVRTRDVGGALAVTEASRAQSLEEGRDVARTFDARAVAKANHATILTYWLGRRRSFVWVITPAAVTVYPLPAGTKIEDAARSYRDLLLGARGIPERSAQPATELFSMLIPSPVKPAPNARVIVVADGQLHTLNFETLMPRSGRYWIEDVVVMSAPSLQLIAQGPKKTHAPASLLLVGDAPAVESYPRLKHAPAEIEKVSAKFVRPTILRGANATPDAYKNATRGRFDVQHFVAHGVASSRRPLDSAIILAAANGNSSYRLLARDVMQQPVDAQLVTISSCYGAGTRTYAGEGVIGLAWAFLKAGADEVIAALWEVNDTATPQLMETMYGEIRKGRDPADALRTAKLQMLRGGGAYRRPLYWAPFVLYAGT